MVSFLYKPWKNNWRDESVCPACFTNLENIPGYRWPQDAYSYPGILENLVWHPAKRNQAGDWYKETPDEDGYYENNNYSQMNR